VLANVRIGIIPSLSARLVKPLFFRIRQEFPGIRLHFFEDYSGELDHRLDSGALDVAVLLRDGATIRPDERALATWETHLIGPPGDRLTQASDIPFASLDRVPLILPSAPSGGRIQLETIARKKGIALSVVAEVNSGSVSYALLGGTGCYLIGPATPPLTTLSRRVRAGHIQAARIVDPIIARTLTLSPSPVRPATQAEQIVMQMICEIIPEMESSCEKAPADAPALIPEFDL
jgi:DNA-binding transcriptional LysR family regulator